MAQSFVVVANPSLFLRPSFNRSVNLPRRVSVRASAVKCEPSKVAPQGDRVLVRLKQIPDKSAGGVLLPKSAVKFERYLMGEILSVGTDVSEVGAGSKVLFSDINAYEVDFGTEEKHVFVKSDDLLAVVE